MEPKKQKFLELIDQAMSISQEILKQKQDFPQERLHNVINQLQAIKNKTLNDQLEPSRGTLTFGLAREVADWIDLDSPLLKAVGKIEQYYQQQF